MIRISDLVRFRHPITGKKAIGIVIQKKVKHVPQSRAADYPDPYIVCGVYYERELIWIHEHEHELERLEV